MPLPLPTKYEIDIPTEHILSSKIYIILSEAGVDVDVSLSEKGMTVIGYRDDLTDYVRRLNDKRVFLFQEHSEAPLKKKEVE